MRFDVLTAKLAAAKAAISLAEAELQVAMAEVRSAPRSEKVRISESLDAAFGELRRATTELARIESTITEVKT